MKLLIALVIGSVAHVGAQLQQQPDALGVACLTGHMQRSEAILRGEIYVVKFFDEASSLLDIAMESSEEKVVVFLHIYVICHPRARAHRVHAWV